MDPDKKANGELILDADIRDKTTGKLLEKNPAWHHTKPETKEGKRAYTFKFENLVRIYFIIQTWQMGITVNAEIINGNHG